MIGRGLSGPLQRARVVYTQYEILTWVCILIFANQLGFGSIVPVVPLYADAFNVSATAIGLTIAIYGVARFALNVPTAQIADRYGRHIALAAGGGITVLGNLISGLSGTYLMFLGGRFVAGAGAAMVITGTQIVVSDISVKANRGRMMAVYQGTFLFAVGFGPIPGGILAEYVSLSAPFFIYSALGVVVALLAWWKIPDTSGMAEDSGTAPTIERAPLGQQLRALGTQSGFVLISVVSFAAFFARTGGLFNLIPTLSEDKLGLTAAQIGLGLGAISFIGLALAYPSGLLADRYGRKMVIVPSTLISGLAMFLFAIMPSFLWFLIACATWAVAIGISGPAPTAYAADMAPPGMNASAMGFYRMLADSGYILGPLLLGFSTDLFRPEISLYATAGLLLASALLFALLAPESFRATAVAPQPASSA